MSTENCSDGLQILPVGDRVRIEFAEKRRTDRLNHRTERGGTQHIMRTLLRRLKKLEAQRRPKRKPRIVVRQEGLDGVFETHESRPAEGDDDETIEIDVVYVDYPTFARETR